MKTVQGLLTLAFKDEMPPSYLKLLKLSAQLVLLVRPKGDECKQFEIQISYWAPLVYRLHLILSLIHFISTQKQSVSHNDLFFVKINLCRIMQNCGVLKHFNIYVALVIP